MTIAYLNFQAVGGRTFLPEGPLGAAGQSPLPSFRYGSIVRGDAEGEFVYLQFIPTASVTLNQGDVFVWDQSYTVVQSNTGSGVHPFGAGVGTLFLAGRVGDPAAAPAAGNYWSYTFTPGVYGVWVQRSGISLLNVASVNAQTRPINTTAVLGRVDQPAVALAGSMGVSNVFTTPTSYAFTANTTTGSVVLTAVSATKGLIVGEKITGTGIASSTVIKDIQGTTVTISLAATATGSAVTMTAAQAAFDCTTVTGSAVLTAVSSIVGVYPNQTLTGTGVSATVVSITGNSAPYTITMSAVATASGPNIAMVATGYYEAFLRGPVVNVQN